MAFILSKYTYNRPHGWVMGYRSPGSQGCRPPGSSPLGKGEEKKGGCGNIELHGSNVCPKIVGFTPKWMVKIMGKAYCLMDDLAGTHIFGNT